MQATRENGYELWLRYRRVKDAGRLAHYRSAIESVVAPGSTASAALIRDELLHALPALLGRDVPLLDRPGRNGVVAGTVPELASSGVAVPSEAAHDLGEDGFLIRSQRIGGASCTVIAGNAGPAVLTGAFHFLRLLQTEQDIAGLDVASRPRIRRRILAHWDNLDGSIERGYAGRSLWNWADLPGKLDPRYHDYARACASVGLNGSCLNNVNASPQILSPEYLAKIAALADLFRPYGLRVYLAPAFSSPMALAELRTSDPRDPAVAMWWRRKADEIYRLIPDFGGFQVKAYSEGQPGPQDYGAGHDDGANVLADALAPHGGVVLWRAFVYDASIDADRARCAYKEFVPLDGRFRPNVLIQAKNGPIDFQPREPFHPLFGAMPGTPLALELQITQEYLGQSKHLVYLGPMWKEVLDSDTYARGAGSTVASVVDGSLHEHAESCVLGVANTGSDLNWCGHHFAQANWYAFGRLAWDHTLAAETIADEWARMTWSNDPTVVRALRKMMAGSWEACVNYMTPLGLHHIMVEGHHYGPDPGFQGAKRADWDNVYFHRADRQGLGYDRSSTGSNAVEQYRSPLSELFDDPDGCPEKFLLWFHHVPWEHRLPSGSALWQELQRRYDAGVASVEEMLTAWQSLAASIDPTRHGHVAARLEEQLDSARLWREVCLDYFGRFAK